MGLRKRFSTATEGYSRSEADPVDRGEAQPSWLKCPHLRSRQAPPRPCRGRPPRSRGASGGHRGIVFRFGFAAGLYNFKFGFIGVFVLWRCRILGSLREGAPAKRVEEPYGTNDSGEENNYIFGNSEIISSKTVSSRGLPQSPSAPAPSRREPRKHP